MQLKILIAFLVCAAITKPSFCQEEKNKTLSFHSINTVGLIEGQAGSSFSLLTVNGLHYKSWFGGIGTGLDFYRYRTIPLFVSLSKEFGKTRNKFFVFADAGTNFYWKKDSDAKFFYVNDKFKGGFYGGGGAGYKLNLNQHRSFLLSAEYSHKKLKETGSYVDASYSEKINYNLNRFIIKTGIEF